MINTLKMIRYAHQGEFEFLICCAVIILFLNTTGYELAEQVVKLTSFYYSDTVCMHLIENGINWFGLGT